MTEDRRTPPDILAHLLRAANSEAHQRQFGLPGDDPKAPQSPQEMVVDAALAVVRKEVLTAMRKHRPMTSPHEGYSVIKEEFDELWDEIKADRGVDPSGLNEVIQTGAMCIRYMVDLFDWQFHPDDGRPFQG